MTETAEPQVRQSKFYLEVLERMKNAPKRFNSAEEMKALMEIEEVLDGAVYSGDPAGRYPNADFDD